MPTIFELFLNSKQIITDSCSPSVIFCFSFARNWFWLKRIVSKICLKVLNVLKCRWGVRRWKKKHLSFTYWHLNNVENSKPHFKHRNSLKASNCIRSTRRCTNILLKLSTWKRMIFFQSKNLRLLKLFWSSPNFIQTVKIKDLDSFSNSFKPLKTTSEY